METEIYCPNRDCGALLTLTWHDAKTQVPLLKQVEKWHKPIPCAECGADIRGRARLATKPFLTTADLILLREMKIRL